MPLPIFSMRQLIEAGCHFGHNTRRWNPLMAPYLYGIRDGIHIIDLQQTVPLLHRAMQAVHDAVASDGRVLFVGTKRQAFDLVQEFAEKCGQYYVNHRWLGGMLTNWQTITKSIKRLRELEEQFSSQDGMVGLTKKETLNLQREKDKLDLALGGIKNMADLPDLIVVIDTNREAIAVSEAKHLNIPVIAVLDSNSDPRGIQYPIPGNDDAIRAIRLYLDLISGSALEGIRDDLRGSGVDMGAQENVVEENVVEESDLNDEESNEIAFSEVEVTNKDDAVKTVMGEALSIVAVDSKADSKEKNTLDSKNTEVSDNDSSVKKSLTKKNSVKKPAAKKTVVKKKAVKKTTTKKTAAKKTVVKKKAVKKTTATKNKAKES